MTRRFATPEAAFLFGLALTLGPHPPAHAEAPTVASLAKEHAALAATGPSSRVENAKLTAGHMELTFASGSRVDVKAGGEVVGFFFSGKGSFRYRSEDAVERPLVQFNTKKATSLTPTVDAKSVTLSDTFTEALVLAAGVELPKADGGAGTDLDAAFRAFSEWAGRIEGPPPAHTFVERRLDAPAGAVFRLEARGGAHPWVYGWQSLDTRWEELDLVRETRSSLADSELKKRLWRSTISRQAAADPRELLLPPFAVTDIAYTLVASDGRDAKLSVVETVVPIGRPRSVLSFALDSIAWDFSETGVANLRSLNVRAVRTADGTALPFDHRRGALLVGLPAPAAPDKPFTLAFEIDGDFLVRPQGSNFWILRGSDFLPMPPSAGRQFTVRSTVRVKKPFVPFSQGATKSRRVEGDDTVLVSELDHPINYPVVMAGNYRFVEETQDGLTVRVASYAMDRPAGVKKLTALAFSIAKYYETFLGPFPVPELNIIEINEYGWAQAPAGTIFITQEAFNPHTGMHDELNQIYSQGINHRFAHEIAHQYWGTVVKRASAQEQWIEEAFAEYSAALFIRDAKGKGHYDMLVARWKLRARDPNDIAPIPLARRIEMPSDRGREDDYVTGLLYGKGPYLLSVLHKEVGEETFLTFLKSYQKSFRWKFGTTKHVSGLLGMLAKKDYGPFFEANFWGTGMPK